MDESKRSNPRSFRTYAYCFTGYDDTAPIFDQKRMAYMVCQREECPSSGRKHWQGYVEFLEAVTWKTCVKLLTVTKSPHVEVRRGTQEQAIAYCKKSESSIKGTLEEYGLPKRQGARSDLDGMFEMIEQRHTVWAIVEQYRGNGLRHIGMIERAVMARWQELPIDKHIYKMRELAPNLIPDE